MNRKRVIYIGILLIVTVIVSITTFSYAFLTRVDEEHGKLNIVVGMLDYKIESNDLNNGSITLSSGEAKEIELKVKAENEIDTKYQLYTNNVENVEIGYLDENGYVESSGTISKKGTKKIKIVLENNSDVSKTVTFGVQGGFEYNIIELKAGRVAVEEGTALDICNLVPGTSFEFAYTGSSQKFTAACNGKYDIELWGAQGGEAIDYNVGLGGYTGGIVNLKRNDDLYVYVGGAGSDLYSSVDPSGGGYNGGGHGMNIYDNTNRSSGGGGATDVRYFKRTTPTSSDLLWDSELGLNSRVMVAAGAGGASYYADGGNAGGLVGTRATADSGYPEYNGGGGTQTSGTFCYTGSYGRTDSYFGKGGVGLSIAGGGGGGYYGGSGGTRSNNHDGSGGGGSSYISGYLGCIAIEQDSDTEPRAIKAGCTSSSRSVECSKHYSGLYFEHGVMIDGAGCDWSTGSATNCGANQPQPDGTTATGHSGNGYARITYLGELNVTFNAGSGTVSETGRKVNYGFEIGELPIPSNGNLVFKGWYLEDTFDTLVDEHYVVTGNVTLYAKYAGVVVVNRSIIDQGTFRNVTPTYLTNQVDGTDGFTIVGRPSQNTNAACNGVPYYKWNTWLRWDYEVDLTDYSTIKVFCRKNVDHGSCNIYISDGLYNAPDCDGSTTIYATSKMGYDRLSVGTWQEFEIDVSNITGTHILSLIGGYQDASGNTSSSTSYSNIRFIP